MTRGWIGVQIHCPVTADIAEGLGLEARPPALLVSEPQPNSPAAKAGIESGDVITPPSTAIRSTMRASSLAGSAPWRRARQVKLTCHAPGPGKDRDADVLGTLPNEKTAS